MSSFQGRRLDVRRLWLYLCLSIFLSFVTGCTTLDTKPSLIYIKLVNTAQNKHYIAGLDIKELQLGNVISCATRDEEEPSIIFLYHNGALTYMQRAAKDLTTQVALNIPLPPADEKITTSNFIELRTERPNQHLLIIAAYTKKEDLQKVVESQLNHWKENISEFFCETHP